MQTFGSDRVRRVGDTLILSTRVTKNWVPRVEKTMTNSEFPGTTVQWDEQFFEVVSAEMLPDNSLRYTLIPWVEGRAMRVVEQYNAETESARSAARRDAVIREHKRRGFNLIGIFVGHLPGDVQKNIAYEYGVGPNSLTLMSTFAIWLIVAFIGFTVGGKLMENQLPATMVIVALFLFVENSWRFMWTFITREPIGSVTGLILYTIYAFASGKPLKMQQRFRASEQVPADIARRDTLAMREAFVTLLPVADQQRIAQRWDYQYRRMSAKVASVILFFAVVGVISAMINGGMISGLVAAAIAGEQLYRLSMFARGPAPSVLGFLVRPVVRKLL